MRAIAAFTLLEVMVALAILALSFTNLVLVQGRAVNWALQARDISIATELARFQLVECKKEAQKKIASVGDLKLEGDFSEQGYEKFTWECHAPKLNFKMPSGATLDSITKKKTEEAGVKTKPGNANAADSMSPVMGMIGDNLGNSLREVALIVRWKEGEIADEIRVVTHVIDPAPMIVLAKMLKQGADQFLGNKKPGANPGPPGGGNTQGRPGGPGMMPNMDGPGGGRGGMPWGGQPAMPMGGGRR